MISRALTFFFCFFLSGATAQETLRVATYNVGLGRDGPGLLLKDIQDRDPDILAIAQIIAQVSPDILLLTDFDNDYRNVALGALQSLLADQSAGQFDYAFATGGNAGLPSGLDLNGNDHQGDWQDNWGFGRFEGNGSMVLLSKFPIDYDLSRSFDHFLWQKLPTAVAPQNPDGTAYFDTGIWNSLRLSSQSHWDILINLPDMGNLRILASHPTPPVFDGPENRNGLRNDAEIQFWLDYLNGANLGDDAGSDEPYSGDRFVILADLNADPEDGESIGIALDALLAHPMLVDPMPESIGANNAAQSQAGANDLQTGNAFLDTVDWADEAIGNLRVDYVLPSQQLRVLGAGVFWPTPDQPGFQLLEAAETAHRLVWVDITLP